MYMITKNKLLCGMFLAVSLSLTACGKGNNTSVESSKTESGKQSGEDTTTLGRVTAVADGTITIMAMNFGNHEPGQKPEGTMPADMPEEFKKGERPRGTMSPDMEEKFQKGEKPEDGRGQGEEKTVTINDNTSIVKQNEDGTTETVDVSQITEGIMIEITGVESNENIAATKIMINTNMKQGGMGRGRNTEDSQEQLEEGTKA